MMQPKCVEIIVLAWERKVEFVRVSLTLNAWELCAVYQFNEILTDPNVC